MTTHGINRLSGPTFGTTEATHIYDLIQDGRRLEADDELRHLVHTGITPTELFEAAMALQHQMDTS